MLDVEEVFEVTMHRTRPLCLVAKHTYLLVGCWMLDVEEVFEVTMHRTRPLFLVAKYMHLLLHVGCAFRLVSISFQTTFYLQIVKQHSLEISQPGVDPSTGLTWQMTKRRRDHEVRK
ncbi:hypothetical protein C4D60_Mb09t06720 [Musa balbisiana]|uniref:Uncharacterized protein n=1 Tax=Musa balbisiana TaxID=52838 RepID=A0A4S8IFB4_MUSBA|nr:hypothetical protein C4D60_Mb09t06720 [Musa balbisiana]